MLVSGHLTQMAWVSCVSLSGVPVEMLAFVCISILALIMLAVPPIQTFLLTPTSLQEAWVQYALVGKYFNELFSVMVPGGGRL